MRPNGPLENVGYFCIISLWLLFLVFLFLFFIIFSIATILVIMTTSITLTISFYFLLSSIFSSYVLPCVLQSFNPFLCAPPPSIHSLFVSFVSTLQLLHHSASLANPAFLQALCLKTLECWNWHESNLTQVLCWALMHAEGGNTTQRLAPRAWLILGLFQKCTAEQSHCWHQEV